MTTKLKVYLAGPMSGLPQFNFPAFFEAGTRLRLAGFEVVSPAEIDCKEDGEVALKSATGDPKEAARSWGDFLSRDVKLLADTGINGIVFLPDWIRSRGARLEATVGLLQKDFLFYEYHAHMPLKQCALELPRWAVVDSLAFAFRSET